MKRFLALLCLLFLIAPVGAQCYSSGRSYYSRSYHAPSYSTPSYDYVQREVITPFYFVNAYAIAQPAQAFINLNPYAVAAAPVIYNGVPAVNQDVARLTQQQAQPMTRANGDASAASADTKEILAAIRQLDQNVRQIHERVQKLEGAGSKASPKE